MSNKFDSYSVLKKLIGNIEPQGNSNQDPQLFENLNDMIYVTEHLIKDIILVARHQNRNEHSMSKAGKAANEFITRLKDTLLIVEHSNSTKPIDISETLKQPSKPIDISGIFKAVKPEEIKIAGENIEKAIAEFNKLLNEEEYSEYYHLILRGELHRYESDIVEKAFTFSGWHKVKCRTSSENGERPGLTGLQLYRNE